MICIKCKKNPLEVLQYPINIKPTKYPSNLKKIIFEHNFNQQIDNLPNTLIEIFFPEHSKFNNSLDCLSYSLKILTLPNNYK